MHSKKCSASRTCKGQHDLLPHAAFDARCAIGCWRRKISARVRQISIGATFQLKAKFPRQHRHCRRVANEYAPYTRVAKHKDRLTACFQHTMDLTQHGCQVSDIALKEATLTGRKLIGEAYAPHHASRKRCIYIMDQARARRQYYPLELIEGCRLDVRAIPARGDVPASSQ